MNVYQKLRVYRISQSIAPNIFYERKFVSAHSNLKYGRYPELGCVLLCELLYFLLLQPTRLSIDINWRSRQDKKSYRLRQNISSKLLLVYSINQFTLDSLVHLNPKNVETTKFCKMFESTNRAEKKNIRIIFLYGPIQLFDEREFEESADWPGGGTGF